MSWRLIQARMYADSVHKGQMYGKDAPYTTHLKAVEEVLKRFGCEDEDMLIAAWLHDSVEDTDTTVDELKDLFGERVAELVWAVTNEEGKNRAERHKKTYKKIAANADAVVLKLADRIANVEASIEQKDPKLGMYKKEFAGFKEALKTQDNSMWRHLEFILS